MEEQSIVRIFALFVTLILAGCGPTMIALFRTVNGGARGEGTRDEGGRMKWLELAAVALLLAGCADDIRLRNPATGEVATCKGGYYSHGLIGMANQTDKELQMRCVDDFQRQGYQRIP